MCVCSGSIGLTGDNVEQQRGDGTKGKIEKQTKTDNTLACCRILCLFGKPKQQETRGTYLHFYSCFGDFLDIPTSHLSSCALGHCSDADPIAWN
jgi:hypothetical protein